MRRRAVSSRSRAIELKFRKVLFERLGLPYTTDDGPELRGKLEKLFKTRTRDEWCALLEGTDACFAPVLSMAEAPQHPHNIARGSFVEIEGVVQPAPAPRFSSTHTSARPDDAPQDRRRRHPPCAGGLGRLPRERIEALLTDSVVAESRPEKAAAD